MRPGLVETHGQQRAVAGGEVGNAGVRRSLPHSPSAISSPGVVTRHMLAVWSEVKVSAQAVMARLRLRCVTVMGPTCSSTYE